MVIRVTTTEATSAVGRKVGGEVEAVADSDGPTTTLKAEFKEIKYGNYPRTRRFFLRPAKIS